MGEFIAHNVIHKNFGKGRILSSYVNEEDRLVFVIKFDALEKERKIYADFKGMRVF